MDLDANHYRNYSQSQYARARELLSQECFCENANVLDVGCGDGKITAEIASLVPKGKVLGIDASPNMIRLANDTFHLPNLEFRLINAEEFITSELFDCILCFSCLLWIRKPKLVLNNLSKLLKPNGELLILTYLRDSAYICFLEKTLENFPQYKGLSTTHTMLAAEEHRSILESNHLQIQTFEIRDLVSRYATREELKNYLRGWIGSFIPILDEHQNEFLNQAVENSLHLSLQGNVPPIILPYKTLIIKAIKKLS